MASPVSMGSSRSGPVMFAAPYREPSPLARLPAGGAFFGKRGQPFRGFGGLALGRMTLDQPVERRRVEVGEGRAQRQRLGFGNRLGAVLEQLAEQGFPRRFELGSRSHPLKQAR